MNKILKTNQTLTFVRYNREFVITEFVITEFDCNKFFLLMNKEVKFNQSKKLQKNVVNKFWNSTLSTFKSSNKK